VILKNIIYVILYSRAEKPICLPKNLNKEISKDLDLSVFQLGEKDDIEEQRHDTLEENRKGYKKFKTP
jgi:hypothetical protein